jgi:DNA recombination protein RmuC
MCNLARYSGVFAVLNLVLIGVIALLIGALIGWLLGGRSASALRAERDLHLDNFRKSIADLESSVRERDDAKLSFATLQAEQSARDVAFEAQLSSLREAKDALTSQFAEVGGKILGDAQNAFLDRAEQRFKQSEEVTGQEIKALLGPVNERLLRYEEAVGKVEAERRDAYGELKIRSRQRRQSLAIRCAMRPKHAGVGGSSSSAMSLKPAAFPNMPILRPK